MENIDLFSMAGLLAIGRIIIIDIMLAGDNAVVIGMAAEKLEPELRQKAIFLGTLGAIIIRLVLAVVLAEALQLIPGLHIVGGLLLLWIAIRLVNNDEDNNNVSAKDNLRDAVVTIIVADAVMSIDNVIGVVGAAGGHIPLVALGILVSVPIIIFCATIFTRIMQRFPVVLYLGGAILGWVSGEMIGVEPLLPASLKFAEPIWSIIGVIIVLAAVGIMKLKSK
jgi:YjbE family integral membrane protein